ncbi:hypothetical protein EJ02DRAFT_469104 [Clathrospora elynae]|uniref:Uncharacterized protein n=1 Tax=Clathrospora elynae TaxID=706981 RepID=A0A6A5SC91_9PLEO|nr:hypothetical protein EJ02DRAFT_469104 [Clathrospora elynae]
MLLILPWHGAWCALRYDGERQVIMATDKYGAIPLDLRNSALLFTNYVFAVPHAIRLVTAAGGGLNKTRLKAQDGQHALQDALLLVTSLNVRTNAQNYQGMDPCDLHSEILEKMTKITMLPTDETEELPNRKRKRQDPNHGRSREMLSSQEITRICQTQSQDQYREEHRGATRSRACTDLAAFSVATTDHQDKRAIACKLTSGLAAVSKSTLIYLLYLTIHLPDRINRSTFIAPIRCQARSINILQAPIPSFHQPDSMHRSTCLSQPEKYLSISTSLYLAPLNPINPHPRDLPNYQQDAGMCNRHHGPGNQDATLIWTLPFPVLSKT